ncbi:MAG: hypothetical protein RIR33_979 [Pseudomonadota bacterium]
MRSAFIIAGAAVLMTGCGPDAATAPNALAAAALEGDTALIAAAQKISDTIGGCARPAAGEIESKVVGLERGSIVMIGCSQDALAATHRLFAVTGEVTQLVTLPDYGASGWFASDRASTAELDAGTGMLTTMRKDDAHGGCGSEGSYLWDGVKFVLQELRWQECGSTASPPFPIVWPLQQNTVADPNGATPAP